MRCALILKQGWPGTFSRSVRDKKGVALRRISFSPGVPQIVGGEDLAAVQADIGTVLFYAAVTTEGTVLRKLARDQEPFDLNDLEIAEAKERSSDKKPVAEASSDHDLETKEDEPEPVSGPNGDPEQNGEGKPHAPQKAPKHHRR